ncbi:hypothetical protein K227x_19510 [Rubripirellula lacrimiformis]|uniref:Transmembrane protein n=1 Tax=Rubripirellula lacrimiformis TaxID=1930273 RepID=A0A517N8W0_9BACT|nr:hypothetical protein [Rubripirellula lacrimiformis]QDT03567.1 hypothetical protein K227x_19510 [Rubripirellula lacrimiformis]
MSFPSDFETENTVENASLPVVESTLRGQGPDHPNVCCQGWTRFGFPLAGLLMVVAIGTAAYFAGRSHTAETKLSSMDLPLLHANAAVTSEKFSCATGTISEEADGLFVLDHNSGLLQCSVIYPRLGRFMGLFTVNVGEALGTGGKGGSFLLLTGRADFPRASNNPVATTVVYVMDTSTGNYASYYVPFNRQAMTAGRTQQGLITLISTGSANPVIDRDTLR